MASSLVLIPLLMTMSETNAVRAPDIHLICEEFVEEAKVFSTQPPSDLIATRAALSKATDMKALKGLFERDFDGLIQTYTANGLSVEQAEAEMLGDLKSWLMAQINVGIRLNGVPDEKEWVAINQACLDNIKGG